MPRFHQNYIYLLVVNIETFISLAATFRLMRLEEEFVEFFNLEKGSVNLYFPGLKKTREGYEVDFHSFANRLEKAKPSLEIKRIGINHNKETANFRKDLDEVLIGDLYDKNYNGIIFLPRFRTWSDPKIKLQKDIYCLTKLLERCNTKSGIFVYKTNEDIKDKGYLDRFMKRVEEATDCALILINEGTNTHCFMKTI